MDAKVEQFYRKVFADLTVSPEEASELKAFFSSLNPPPDKLVWLRATAFRLGCEFLSGDGGDDSSSDRNMAVLRAINAIIHCLETACMVPRLPNGNSEYDGDKVEEFLKGIFSDPGVDQEQNQKLLAFLRDNIPPSDSLVTMRDACFKTASNSLSEDKAYNVNLLRSINVVVHGFETSVFQ